MTDDIRVGSRAIGAGAAAGMLAASVKLNGALTAAKATGLAGGAATNWALATLGGGAVAIGGKGVLGGVMAVAGAAALPAAAVAVTLFSIWKIRRWGRL